MAALEWSAELALDLSAMDQTHQEFVGLWAQVDAAQDGQLLAAWAALVAHTEGHFGQEDQWMQSTGFAAGNCHSLQHRVVLQLMREGAERAAQGNLQVVRGMAADVASWFLHHAQTMDAALARHLKAVDFDPATGAVHRLQAVPVTAIQGCGGACASGGGPADPGAPAQPLGQAA